MGESPLGEVTLEGSRSIRLTILPTWGNAVSVRLMSSQALTRIEGRRLQNQAGSGIGPQGQCRAQQGAVTLRLHGSTSGSFGSSG